MSRKRSEIWLHFDPINQEKAKCLNCHAEISYKGGGTGNLRKHATSKHPCIDLNSEKRTQSNNTVSIEELPEPGSSTSAEVIVSITKQHENNNKRQTTIKEFGKKKINLGRMKLFNTVLIRMIAIDLQPFSIVENQGFKEVIHFFEPSLELPSRTTLSRTYLEQLHESCKRKLEELLEFSSDITLTTDTWISNSNKSFMAITAHFISKEWIFHKCLLNCFEVEDRHTKENLKDLLIREVNKWGLASKVRTIVTDNAANIVAAVKLTDWNHFPCFAHTLNLVVQQSLQTISGLQSKVKHIVEYFHHSTPASNELSKIQRNTTNSSLCLIMDIKTRWNSTYDMFQRFCQLYIPIKATLAILNNPVEIIQESEFGNLKNICDILKPFKETTLEMSADKNITISKIMIIINSLNQNLSQMKPTVSKTNQLFIDHLQKNLIKRFADVEKNILLTHSAFLDPRFKDKAFKNELLLETCKSQIVAILNEKMKDKTPIFEVVEDEQEIVEESLIWTAFDKLAKTSKKTPISSYQIELMQYCEEPLIPRKNDPLLWWKSKEQIYPNLAPIAKSVLGTVATSVPCERVFSTAGDLISEKRNRLDDETVSKLLFTNSILRIRN